ncbi:MAG: magnesium chelatase subunit D family protein [Candidatus Obscuribacterales bacterium]|nr:magnesium chelatase subunit D family protein [Candidatus Obscuribacterales bacterium]
MKPGYPFSAIVGQDLLKTALMLCGIDQSIGGVLIRGDKGTAKSTAARGLAELLPQIDLRPSCQFNCVPSAPIPLCEVCNSTNAAAVELRSVPFINLPIGATEDRVIGTLDLESALSNGKQRLKPGLLAAAHRGILYIDEVNLLPDHLVDVLLDAAAMAQNTVQREGLSVSHPARFSLIGTMNPEEGDLRPQLLDRFGMMVEVKAPDNAAERMEVVRRRLDYDADSETFAKSREKQQHDLRAALGTAQAILPAVTLSNELLSLISTICCEMRVISLRADITMTKVVRALAALDGRKVPDQSDVRLAAKLVLPHRRRTNPLEKSGLDEEHLDEITNEHKRNNEPSRERGGKQPNSDSEQESKSDDEADALDDENTRDQSQNGDDGSEIVFAPPEELAPLQARIKITESASSEGLSGKRSSNSNGRSGQYVRAVRDSSPSSLAVDATIKHALLQGRKEFKVTTDDLHAKVRSQKKATIIILVVDASGSMSAMRRMEAVKGAAMALLSDAYQKRDQVSIISFRGDSAQLLVAPTRSVDLVSEQLTSLPTGGRTPLADALRLAMETACKQMQSGNQPLLVLLTDGRGNVSTNAELSPQDETVANATRIAESNIPSIVVDTEEGFVRLGEASKLARTMGAEYITMERLSAQSLTITIRTRLNRG